MNFIKTCFNSFFRTLGRILCYVAIGMILSFLFSKIDVHADSDKYVKLNGVTLNYKDYVYIPQGNIPFEFNDGVLYDIPSEIPQNFLITFCSSDDKITNWYSNVTDKEFPHDLNIYKTNIPCQYSTSDYAGGRITYFYGKSFSFSATGSNGSSWGRWTFYSYSGSYQLLNFITTNDDISIDFSSGALITQNEQIIAQNKDIISQSKHHSNQNDQIINQGKETNSKLDQAENTRKGIWETIKGIPESIANAIKGLFIPDNFDFLNDFKDTLSNKLGFIAEVPIKLLDFIISLADFTWTEFTSITFPKIEIMGVSFWDDITIDVGPILGGLKKYRYLTDVLCVTLCVNTLRKMYDKFNGGSGE